MKPKALAALVSLTTFGCRHVPPAPIAVPPTPAAHTCTEYSLRPEALDPQANKWLEEELAAVDSTAPKTGPLVVYLIGANSKPIKARAMIKEIAALGFHVVAPMYANDYQITEVCDPAKDPDDDCHAKARLEAFDGQDHSPHLEGSRANSIEGRVARMLARLAQDHPDEGWSAYLDGDQPRWAEIILAGQSHGASSAGLIGKVRKLRRVVMFSGPFDNRAGVPAAWTHLPAMTPVDRVYGISHLREPQHQGHLKNWAAMGLVGTPVTVEGSAPSFAGSHQLVTTLTPLAGKNPHGVSAASGASPRNLDGSFVLAPAWRYLFGL